MIASLVWLPLHPSVILTDSIFSLFSCYRLKRSFRLSNFEFSHPKPCDWHSHRIWLPILNLGPITSFVLMAVINCNTCTFIMVLIKIVNLFRHHNESWNNCDKNVIFKRRELPWSCLLIFCNVLLRTQMLRFMAFDDIQGTKSCENLHYSG